ncbi:MULTISPECIES: CDP-glycerol glycerophosphotransferase family protein [unclassified Virgibacillus]|uniref:CDP-glycerol glycerophosphotransferase family protein n=1 Tax=unclassified Virgibacillus TaxID=2620237 RepID=UPI000EF46E43|nr:MULTISPECIES: CDP-glycerol glycerophosphotransferase family protein [unclassified Virgibacillus]MDY7045828.1 CDP-glycerol glycerophosphotransferase family protein [Virgibacillus sp. M23]
MSREVVIAVYLFIFRILFNLFRLLPMKRKTTFIASIGHNVSYTAKELKHQATDSIVILKTNRFQLNFNPNHEYTMIHFKACHPFDWLRSVYHLATSHVVFVDNYYGILAVTNFRSNVKVVQLWHAAGAIKKFGLQDRSNQYRSRKARNRFRKVYQRFTHVVVGSERMASIFIQSFGIKENKLLRTGVPRTDFFFQPDKMKVAMETIQHSIPFDRSKKVILYAPTYRKTPKTDIQLDLQQFHVHMKHDYVLFLSIHPSERMKVKNKYPNFVFDVSRFSLNHILTVTDILITDYSSIPFEFSLLKRPMVFYAYDLQQYKSERGIWDMYEDQVPGPVVMNTMDAVQKIKEGSFNLNRVYYFSKEWNTYSTGVSSKELIKAIYSTKIKN